MRIIRGDGYNDVCFQFAYFFISSLLVVTGILLGGLPECCFKKISYTLARLTWNLQITPFRKEHDLPSTSMRTCSMSFFRGVSKQSCTRNLLSSSICCSFHVKLPSCFVSRKVSWGWLKHSDCNITRFAVPFGTHILEPTPLYEFLIKFATCFWNQCQSSSNIMSKKQQQQQQQQPKHQQHKHQHLHIATSQKISPNFDTVKTHLRWPSKHRWISSTSTCPLISPPFWWKMRLWVAMTSHLFGNGSVKQGRTLDETLRSEEMEKKTPKLVV